MSGHGEAEAGEGSRGQRLRAWAVRAWRADRVVSWTVVAFALTQVVAMLWDLPGSHGWENDGIAPRDLFGGIAFNLTPGKGHRYPLFHYLVVAVGSLPFVLWGAFQAAGWTLKELMATILSPPVMTGVSLVAKATSVAMSCVSVAVLARMARRLVSPEAARWAAVLAATNVSIAYYGRVSNLDGPYMMWTVLAMDRLLTIAERGTLRDYIAFAFFTGAAVATKDQAYAAFVLVGLGFMVLGPVLLRDLFRASRAEHFKRLGVGVGVGALTLGVLGGGLLNPTGWLARVKTMTGGASQDWRTYEGGFEGLWANVVDIVMRQELHWWPWPVVALGWLGLVVALGLPRGEGALQRRAWRALPGVAALSTLVCFTLVVGRSGYRFVLPVAFWLALYGGVACAQLVAWAPERGRRVAQGVLAGLMVWAACHSLQVHLTQLYDGRRDVTAYLDTLPKGSVVETYGLLVYQPHFNTGPDAPYALQRVGAKAVKKRNPLYGAREVVDTYNNVHTRAPDVLVVTQGYAARYLPSTHDAGRTASVIIQRYRKQDDGRTFFRAAVADRLPGYRHVMTATTQLPGWAVALGASPVGVHNSTHSTTWVLRRDPDAAPPAAPPKDVPPQPPSGG